MLKIMEVGRVQLISGRLFDSNTPRRAQETAASVLVATLSERHVCAQSCYWAEVLRRLFDSNTPRRAQETAASVLVATLSERHVCAQSCYWAEVLRRGEWLHGWHCCNGCSNCHTCKRNVLIPLEALFVKKFDNYWMNLFEL